LIYFFPTVVGQITRKIFGITPDEGDREFF